MTEGVGLAKGERFWAMVTIALAISMATLDGTIANVALPTIAYDLHVSYSTSIWVINAYQLTLCICLLPLSSLGDMVGYRKVYCSGLAIFCAASLACAISSSLPALTLARVIQGLGAAGILSVNAAIIRLIFPKDQLGRGVGINAFIVAVSAALGPTIAAGILSVGTWEWLFAINIPIGLTALKIATRRLPDSHGKGPYDWTNAILYGMTIAILIITIDGLGHQGKPLQIVSGFGIALVMGIVLIKREKEIETPLFPVDLFKVPLFSSSIATSICSFIAQMAAFTSLPFFMQHILNRTDVQTGLLITPWPIATALTAPIAGRLADRYSVGILGGTGLGVFALGLFFLSRIPIDASDGDIMWRMAICGAGFGLFQAPNNRAILTASPQNRSGAASGMLGTARLLGQTMGASWVSLAFGLSGDEPMRFVLYSAGILSIVAAAISMIRIAARFRNPH